jgi:hypothetical protein
MDCNSNNKPNSYLIRFLESDKRSRQISKLEKKITAIIGGGCCSMKEGAMVIEKCRKV